jgi:2-succinyl-5-enolpyruvyl-6-hydroxy-3-cyclohexene-1-carboxylate synthase
VAYWRSEVARAVGAASTGPVHVNLPLREPLVPDGDDTWVEPLDDERADALQPVLWTDPGFDSWELPWCERGVVVLADDDEEAARSAASIARAYRWPLVAEPTSPLAAYGGADVLPGAALLLADAEFVAAHRPDSVLVVGRPTLTRGVLALVRSAREHRVVDVHGSRPDPTRTAGSFHATTPTVPETVRRATPWWDAWTQAGDRAVAAVNALIDSEAALSEPLVRRDVVAGLPAGALLFLGSSRPVRDVDAFAPPRPDLRVLANRGVAGIDGNVSTAWVRRWPTAVRRTRCSVT